VATRFPGSSNIGTCPTSSSTTKPCPGDHLLGASARDIDRKETVLARPCQGDRVSSRPLSFAGPRGLIATPSWRRALSSPRVSASRVSPPSGMPAPQAAGGYRGRPNPDTRASPPDRRRAARSETETNRIERPEVVSRTFASPWGAACPSVANKRDPQRRSPIYEASRPRLAASLAVSMAMLTSVAAASSLTIAQAHQAIERRAKQACASTCDAFGVQRTKRISRSKVSACLRASRIPAVHGQDDRHQDVNDRAAGEGRSLSHRLGLPLSLVSLFRPQAIAPPGLGLAGGGGPRRIRPSPSGALRLKAQRGMAWGG
jgi:hypothetical protein